jgi:hypothetical protein
MPLQSIVAGAAARASAKALVAIISPSLVLMVLLHNIVAKSSAIAERCRHLAASSCSAHTGDCRCLQAEPTLRLAGLLLRQS